MGLPPRAGPLFELPPGAVGVEVVLQLLAHGRADALWRIRCQPTQTPLQPEVWGKPRKQRQ